jgi:RNA:NAD 2'-phosphotransferase (TPT1/KptA family)
MPKNDSWKDQPRVPAGSEDGGRWVTVYHGTPNSNLRSIKRHGLLPQGEGRVFVTRSKKLASVYTGYKGTVLVARVRAGDLRKEFGSAMSTGPIPPANINFGARR